MVVHWLEIMLKEEMHLIINYYTVNLLQEDLLLFREVSLVNMVDYDLGTLLQVIHTLKLQLMEKVSPTMQEVLVP